MVKKCFLVGLLLLALVKVSFADPITAFVYGEIKYKETLPILQWQIYQQGMTISMQNHQVDKIVVIICSPGGSVMEAVAMFDYLRSWSRNKVPVHTVASGYCQSAATIVLQAGDRRYSTESTIFMTHNAYLWIRADTAIKQEDLDDLDKDFTRERDRMIGIFARRMRLKPFMLEKYFTDVEYYFDPVTAYQVGFIDELLRDGPAFEQLYPHEKNNTNTHSVIKPE